MVDRLLVLTAVVALSLVAVAAGDNNVTTTTNVKEGKGKCQENHFVTILC